MLGKRILCSLFQHWMGNKQSSDDSWDLHGCGVRRVGGAHCADVHQMGVAPPRLAAI